MFIDHVSKSRFALALPALIFVAAAHSQSISVQPRVSAGFQDYELNFPSVTFGNPNGSITFRDAFKVSDRLHFVGGGLTVGYGRLFVDVAGQKNSTGHNDDMQLQGTNIGGMSTGATNAGVNHDLVSAFTRKEFNATVGWGFTPEFSAYVGYKHSEAEINSQMSPIVGPGSLVPGDLLFLGPRNIAFSYNGFFVGATYSFPVEIAHGSFAVQSSVARLNGVYKESFGGIVTEVVSVVPLQLALIDPSFANRAPLYGRSTGLNLGVSWTGGFQWISENLHGLSYTIGIDRSEYKFSSRQTRFGNFQETSTRLRLDLRYRFASGSK